MKLKRFKDNLAVPLHGKSEYHSAMKYLEEININSANSIIQK
jgi:hypothetical protein